MNPIRKIRNRYIRYLEDKAANESRAKGRYKIEKGYYSGGGSGGAWSITHYVNSITFNSPHYVVSTGGGGVSAGGGGNVQITFIPLSAPPKTTKTESEDE